MLSQRRQSPRNARSHSRRPLSLHTRTPGVSRQRGAGMLSWICILAVAALLLTLALRLIPHYIDFRTMVGLIEDLPAGEVHDMTKKDIRDTLTKRFKINNIRDLKVTDVLTIERSRGETILLLDYEVRENMVANIDLVVMFDQRFDYR